MRLGHYRRALLAGFFGLLMCLASWFRPDGFLDQFNMLAYMFGLLVSGNVHQPSEVAVYLAIWAQWSVIGYGFSVVFFPRQARS